MLAPAAHAHFRLDIVNRFQGLQVLSFFGTQAISQPFVFELEVLIEQPYLDLNSLMYQCAFLSFKDPQNGIHGQIQGAVRSHFRAGPACYQLTIGPRLACLGQRHNQRIFQNLSAVQIIERVLAEHGIKGDSYRFDLKGDCQVRDYCAQYQESDLQLVQRLCAEEGIHYHFWHSPSGHQLVFGDGLRVFRRSPPANFQQAPRQAGVSQFSVRTRGSDDAAHRTQQAQGESTLPFVAAGYLLPLKGHPETEWNHLWLVNEVEHRGFDLRQLGHATGNETALYVNHFKAAPWEAGFKPPSSARTCAVDMQRARIVGEPGEPARLDAKGRVHVLLEWDYQGQGTLLSECWLPMAETLAARLQGGMSVVVSFTDGDLDRPLITSCLVSMTWPAAKAPQALPVPATAGIEVQLDAQMFIGDERCIHLNDGTRITWQDECELSFTVGGSTLTIDAAGLKLLSPQVLFTAPAEKPDAASDPM